MPQSLIFWRASARSTVLKGPSHSILHSTDSSRQPQLVSSRAEHRNEAHIILCLSPWRKCENFHLLFDLLPPDSLSGETHKTLQQHAGLSTGWRLMEQSSQSLHSAAGKACVLTLGFLKNEGCKRMLRRSRVGNGYE